MKIFSYQHPIVLETIKKEGIYSPSLLHEKNDFLKDCIYDSHGFLQSYAWLQKKMLEKGIASIGNPQDLIWGWGEKHSFNSFDLRYKNNRQIYNDHILFELEIPENRLCATCYNNWHNILNNSPIALTDEEYDKYNVSQELKEASWNNVFDVYFNGEEPFIQYTFFQILKDDIISIKEIKNYKVHKIKNRFKNNT